MRKFALLLAPLALVAAFNAHAIILFDDPDPPANRIAPTGALAGSGWQYQGEWGPFLGTPIAPHFFITAMHIQRAGATLFYNGVNYTPVQSFFRFESDLMIWQVRETIPSFAPLYTGRSEQNRHLVVFGRGTDRGGEVVLNNTVRGWHWGADNHVQRWGENDVFDIVSYNGHDLLYALFDQHAQPNDHPNEAHLSSGDSGGGVFMNDAGTWKLIGINFSVDDVFTAPDPDSAFAAALYDARDYYQSDGQNPPTFTPITGANPVPTGFYSSRIASELHWIGRAIADPQPGRDGNSLTLTYSRIIAPASDIVYTIEQSPDLVAWTTATPSEEILSTDGGIERVKASVNPGAATTLFLRLRVTRP